MLVSAGVDSLAVRWSEGFAPGAAGFRLRWRQRPAPADGGSAWSSVDLDGGVREYTIGGLEAATAYRLRLNALDAEGSQGVLAVGEFVTLAPPPRGLVAVVSSSDGVRLGWDEPAGWLPAGYVVRWRMRGPVEFSGEVSLGAEARSHVVEDLVGGEYVFRVTARTLAGGESDPAITGVVVAGGDGVLGLTSAGVDTLTVRWAEGFAPDAAGFRLRWRVIPTVGGEELMWSSVDLDAGVREYTIGGLEAATAYRLRLNALDVDGTQGVLAAGSFATAAPEPSCADGAVGNTVADAALLVECNVQVGLADVLVGAGAGSLNWSSTLDIAQWDGVTVAGTPRRVAKLDLANKELAGELPARLVNLEELTELRLNGNNLGGRIPSELGLLRKLTHLYVAGNSFEGCYPPHWDDIANNDLAELDLPSCAIPYDLRTTTGLPEAGAYALLSDATDVHSAFEPRYMDDVEAVLVHQSDANGTSVATFYDTIQPGDVFDLTREAKTKSRGCFRRFEVTEVLPDPAGATARKLFKVQQTFADVWDCDMPSLYNKTEPVDFYWYPAPWVWGREDIREYVAEPVTGPGRYWMASNVTFEIPDGVTLDVIGEVYFDATVYQTIVDLATGARLGFESYTGKVAGRDIPEGLSDSEKAAASALLEMLASSIETPRREG